MPGLRPSDLISLSTLNFLDIRNPDRLLNCQVVGALIFVGGMCAGKSTLAKAIVENPSTAHSFAIAARVTTRDRRLGDDSESVTHITWDAFERRRTSGDLALSWIRPLSDGGAIGYGCESVKPGFVSLQLAGHGIYSNQTSLTPSDVLQRSLVIGVHAPEEERFERVRRRSPDLGSTRLDALMRHDDDLMFSSVDVVINNAGASLRPLEEAVQFASIVAARCSSQQTS